LKKEFNRRDFLVTAVKALTIGLLGPLSSMAITQKTSFAGEASEVINWDKVWEGKEWGFIVDTSKCIGCGRCVIACKQENGVPMDKEVFRTWVERYAESANGHINIESPGGGLDFEQGNESSVKQFFVPKLCNQCQHAPCTQVCPVGATYKTGDGVVLVDRKRCVGCRYCIQACPYGARFFHPELNIVDKCTWCYHRVVKGMKPACVQVCPKGARKFGNLKNPASEVEISIKKEKVRVLKPDLGTEPHVFYIDLDEVVK
jgi:Fe-S-cluster-containing dehydrogenase component